MYNKAAASALLLMTNIGKRRHSEEKKTVISVESLVIFTWDGCEIQVQIFELSFLPLDTCLHLKYILKAHLLLKSKLIKRLSDPQHTLLSKAKKLDGKQ